MLKKLIVPTLVLAISAVSAVGCRDNSGDATPFPDAGGPDGSSTMDAPVDGGAEPDAVVDAPAADSGDAKDAADTGANDAGDASGDATHG
jgi:hypothetical protein